VMNVSKYSVALVVGGGVIWVVGAVFYSALILSCFPSCGPRTVLAPGVEAAGYPPSALLNLAWDDLYANLYVATIGLLAITIGLTAFRRAEKWAWYAIVVFTLAGVLTALLDYESWGGWYTFLFLGLPPLSGLILSARSFFQ
jgi:hypothetical protein